MINYPQSYIGLSKNTHLTLCLHTSMKHCGTRGLKVGTVFVQESHR